MNARFDVVAVGNALVDVIGSVEEGFLAAHGIVKGSMSLVDEPRSAALYSAIPEVIETSGGSAANTAYGVASLGGRAAFIGKVADDSFGRAFALDLHRVGVEFLPVPVGLDESTGRCIIAVTPDGQRSMSTYLGAAAMLTPGDVDAATAGAGEVLFLEGYLFDRPEAKEAFRVAAAAAHAAGRRVALTLSDSFCVERHRDDFLAMVRDEVDVLFSNESELLSLYRQDDFSAAVSLLRDDCEFAAITRDHRGSVVVDADRLVTIAPVPVDHVVDATGAGDLYAAGFLVGVVRGLDVEECGRLGSIAASEAISHMGPRPVMPLRDLVPAELRAAVRGMDGFSRDAHGGSP